MGTLLLSNKFKKKKKAKKVGILKTRSIMGHDDIKGTTFNAEFPLCRTATV